jgi:hypothetical protein
MIVIVVAAYAMDVVMVSMAGDTEAFDVVRDVLFARHGMLQVDADQWHDTGELGY